MNPLTNIPSQALAHEQSRTLREHSSNRIRNGQRVSDHLSVPVNHLIKKAKHETILTTSLAADYFHTFLYPLMMHYRRHGKINLLHEFRMLEIKEMNLQIALPRPFHSEIWEKQRQIKEVLHQGSIIQEDNTELYFYFSFADAAKTSITIIDIPFVLMSLVDVHHKKLKTLVGKQSIAWGDEQLSFDLKYELTSFKMMIEYLCQGGEIDADKVKIGRF